MDVTKEEFEAYESVRESGVTNMFDLTTVCAYSGLTRDQVRRVMDNYSEARDKYKQDA